MRRASTLPMLFGLALGLAAGLYYSWRVDPVAYIDTDPSSLRADYKAEYLSLVASAYAATGDLERARLRLAWLALPEPAETLSRMAQSRLAASGLETEARALAALAAALGERPLPVLKTPAPGETPATPTASPTVAPTPTRAASPTPSPTPGSAFELVDREAICDPALGESLLQIEVLDAAGEGVPGIQVLVIWDEGQDRFYTGLKPELGLGYADFSMQPGTVYSLQLSQATIPITGLAAEDCVGPEGESYPGSIQLTFQQPPASP